MTTNKMTGTLINDIIETVDNRLTEAKKLRQWADEGPITEAQSSRYLDRAEALEEAVRESESPLDDNTAGEPLDEMERRTR